MVTKEVISPNYIAFFGISKAISEENQLFWSRKRGFVRRFAESNLNSIILDWPQRGAKESNSHPLKNTNSQIIVYHYLL